MSPARNADLVRPIDLSIFIVMAWHEGHSVVCSLHASEASARAVRRKGETIEAWGVHDLMRRIDGTGAAE